MNHKGNTCADLSSDTDRLSDANIDTLDRWYYFNLLRRIDPALPGLVCEAFRRLWISSISNVRRASSLYEAEYRGVDYAGPRYVRWEHDIFLLAVNEGLAHWKKQLGNAETGLANKLESILFGAIAASINNHASVLYSRVIRPPEVDELWTMGRNGIVSKSELSQSDCHSGWLRCGIYEELIEADTVFSSEKTPASAVMYGGVTLEGKGYTCNDFEPLPYVPAEFLLRNIRLADMAAELMEPASWLGPLCAYGYLRDDVGRWPVVGFNAGILAKYHMARQDGRTPFSWCTAEGIEVARLRVWRSEPSGYSVSGVNRPRRTIGSDFIIRADFLKRLEIIGLNISPMIIRVQNDDT